jgi:hypothetical protein
MRIEVLEAPARSGYAKRIAFLAAAPDPSRGAPRAVQREIREACRASSFGGREKEVASDKGGRWLGSAPADRPVEDSPLRSEDVDGKPATRERRDPAGVRSGHRSRCFALCFSVALSDYSFDRYNPASPAQAYAPQR